MHCKQITRQDPAGCFCLLCIFRSKDWQQVPGRGFRGAPLLLSSPLIDRRLCSRSSSSSPARTVRAARETERRLRPAFVSRCSITDRSDEAYVRIYTRERPQGSSSPGARRASGSLTRLCITVLHGELLIHHTSISTNPTYT